MLFTDIGVGIQADALGLEEATVEDPSTHACVSLDDAVKKLMAVVNSIKQEDPYGTGYVSRAFAARLVATLDEAKELMARGEPSRDS